MRPRTVIFAVVLVIMAAWTLRVQGQTQPSAPTDPIVIPAVFLDPTQVADISLAISKRAEHLAPLFEQVHPADWVAKGAPEAYIRQWNSLEEQNRAIQADMDFIAQHPEAMEDTMRALFRIHRFETDLDGLLKAVRRYQDQAVADQLESAAVNDHNGVEQLQQYILNLANEKEQQLAVEDKEAQRCRSVLAAQPPGRSVAPKRPSNTSK